MKEKEIKTASCGSFTEVSMSFTADTEVACEIINFINSKLGKQIETKEEPEAEEGKPFRPCTGEFCTCVLDKEEDTAESIFIADGMASITSEDDYVMLGAHVALCSTNDLFSPMKLHTGGNLTFAEPYCRKAKESEKQLLLEQMNKEGFSWDEKKCKVVKKLWLPGYDEEYWYPFHDDSKEKFYPGRDRYLYHIVDKERFQRGWAFRTMKECQQFCDKLNEAINNVKP